MSDPAGPGEALERKQRQRRATALYLAMIAGAVIGYVYVVAGQVGPGFHQGAMAAPVAVALAVVWLASMAGASLWYRRHLDEIERAAQLGGVAAAGSAFFILYPAWYLLWRGQLTIEPNAHLMFGALYVVMILAYLWKKFR